MIISKNDYKENCRLNNSRLGLITVSPYLFFSPERQEEKEYFTLGTLVNDILLLTVEEFSDKYYITKAKQPGPKMTALCIEVFKTAQDLKNPNDKEICDAAKIISYGNFLEPTIIKKFKEEGLDYYNSLVDSLNKKVITEDLLGEANTIVDSIKLKPAVLELMTGGMDEVALTWEYKGHECKGLIDKIQINHDLKQIKIVDLKTTVENPYSRIISKNNSNNPYNWIVTNFLRNVLYEYDYLRQLSWYAIGCMQEWPEYSIEIKIVVVGKKYPNDCAIYDFTDVLGYGVEKINNLLDLIDFHKAQDNWVITKQEFENDGVYLKL